VLRRSIEMLVRLGDRAGALRAYDDFANRLRKELESDPSPETVRLMESIRTGTHPVQKA
jgi:DNA-binding SARP family transcriptional activator